MTDFRERGFLSDEARGARLPIRLKHASWFAFCDDLNETGHRVLYSAKPSLDDNQALLLAMLLGRLLTNFQGAVVMAELPMSVEGRTLARAALETTFVIRAVLCDPKVIDDLVEAEHRNRRVMREMLLQTPDLAETDRAKLLTGLKEDPKGKRIDVEALARKGGMHRIYELYYRSLSQVSHLTLGALEQYARADDGGHIQGLEYGPKFDLAEITGILVPASFSMLMGLDGVAGGLKLSQFDEDVQRLKHGYHELVPGEPQQQDGDQDAPAS